MQLAHEEQFEIAGLAFRALHVPGHTSGALAYVTGDAVFTGDTLFAAGCGRLFEGTPKQMYESLNVKLGGLPDATRVFCGHEYTASNLRFARSVEPDNADVPAKVERVASLRARGEPTVPSSIGDERRTNPFMRCDSPAIRRSFEGARAPWTCSRSSARRRTHSSDGGPSAAGAGAGASAGALAPATGEGRKANPPAVPEAAPAAAGSTLATVGVSTERERESDGADHPRERGHLGLRLDARRTDADRGAAAVAPSGAAVSGADRHARARARR